jgi:outer membrane receptor protein involved in Fe transport
MSYGHRKGSDYEPGDGPRIPSSYENRDIWGELSRDLTPHQRLDFSFSRFDQTHTEYPGQFFDIGHLGTYAFNVRVVDTDPTGPWSELAVEAWYNNTSFRGDTRNKHNVDFPVMQRVEYALDQQFLGTTNRVDGETRGGNYSSGGRVATRFGDLDDTHVNAGVDFRYLGQTISERLVWLQDGAPLPIVNIMPHAWSVDPGVFAEWSSPLTDDWTVSVGARADYVETKARMADVPVGSSLNRDAPEEQNVLYAFYINNRIALNECWTLTSGVGHAQRPPTLIERYADAMFLGVAQSGFTRITGDPLLNPERSWQIDLGLSTEQQTWRGRMTGFYAWLLDYVTYRDGTVVVPDFADARLLLFTNTPAASLAGFELAGEWDWTTWLTPYATMSYVEGRDETIHAPLTSIPPLDTRLGARLHNAGPERRWGIECEARIVDNQDRLGTIRVHGGQDLRVIEEPTPGFTVWNLRAYWNARENLNFFAGIDNLFDKNYQEHLDLRLLGPTGFAADPTRVLSPGFTPYVGMNWVY